MQLTQHQFDALVSFVYNCGTGAFLSSTMLRLINYQSYADAADQFLEWVHGEVDGKKVVLPGLVSRRGAERAMFLTPDEPEAA